MPFPPAETIGSDGLSTKEAQKRLREHGPNLLPRPKHNIGPSLLAQFTHFMAWLLWLGGAIAFIARLPELGLAVWLVNVLNGLFSFLQEFRAEQATAALQTLLPVKARVIRDGRESVISASELVIGDLIILGEGARISADARLIEQAGLFVSEAALTGESEPVAKSAESIPETENPLEQSNAVFAGTNVTRGLAKAIVFATGANTKIGQIASTTERVRDRPSPLQRELETVTRIVTAIAVGVGAVFFMLALGLVGMTTGESLIFALGMIVAFVPEGLLPTVTLALSMSTQRMAKRKALVKRLSAVETLGATTVICSDKTGTLTKNEMTVEEIALSHLRILFSGTGYEGKGEATLNGERLSEPRGEAMRRILSAVALCNDAQALPPPKGDGNWTILGDPTEGALLLALNKMGLNPEREKTSARRVSEIPFDAERRLMSTLHEEGPSQYTLYTKGSPADIIGRCSHKLEDNTIEMMSESERNRLQAMADGLARRGLRVLGFAMRKLGEGDLEHRGDKSDQIEPISPRIEIELTFLGFAALRDPLRPEAKMAVAQCKKAGIRVLMLTGDHALAAEHIARDLGIIQDGARIITGNDLKRMSDAELAEALKEDIVFARTVPEQKLRIVAALQSQGHVVAVTGDGVNDAPALKKADIGVAMGKSGTDVAREAADMILLDDNFASIVAAIEEGRAVYSNIRKFTSYIFTSNAPEAIPFVLFAFSQGRIPLALGVMHILAVDLGTDIVPALALAAEPPEPQVMNKAPRKMGEHIITKSLLIRSYLFLGALQALAVMLAFYAHYWINGHYGQFIDLPASGSIYRSATSMALGAVVATQIGNLIAHRSDSQSLFSMLGRRNSMIKFGILSEIGLLLLFIYVPPVGRLIGTGPVPAWQIALLAALVPLLLIADEIRKRIRSSLEKRARQSLST